MGVSSSSSEEIRTETTEIRSFHACTMSTQGRSARYWKKPFKRKNRHGRKKSKEDVELPSPKENPLRRSMGVSSSSSEEVRTASRFRRWFERRMGNLKSSSLRKEQISTWHGKSLSSTDLDEISQDLTGNQKNQLRVTADISKRPPSISTVDEWGEEDEEKDEDDIFFENTFLDSDYKIKDDVHEKLKRFFKTWLCYEYGIMAPNQKIPRTHLYVTVKNGIEKSEVFQDLKESFNCDPTKYFDIRDEPKTTSKFKFCTRPGGRICAKEVAGPNQVAVQGGVESCSLGTLTMFCFHRGHHYALTCFHIGCQNENQQFQEEFNEKSILNLRETFRGLELQKLSKDYYNNTKKYYYRPMQNPDEDDLELGSYERGIFDQNYDIMTIKVKGDVQIECKVAGVVSHSWGTIKRLYTRFYSKRRRDPIIVQKAGSSSNETSGCIENLSCDILCDDNKDVLFYDAVKVKSSSAKFLEAGDSGALISFLDSNGRQQPFAYFICERGQFFYCLKLDKALRELGLWDAGCFDQCARANRD